MPKSCIISINDKPGQTFAEFSPQSQTVAPGDLINWRNNTSKKHRLVLKAKPEVTWVDEIPGKLPNQPAPTSQQGVSFSKPTTPGLPVQYMCAFHPEEIGEIIAQ